MKLTPDERALILKHRKCKAEQEARYQELWDALSLPFDEALPIVRKHINADFKVAFDERVAAWCVANSEAIALIMKETKHAR